MRTGPAWDLYRSANWETTRLLPVGAGVRGPTRRETLTAAPYYVTRVHGSATRARQVAERLARRGRLGNIPPEVLRALIGP